MNQLNNKVIQQEDEIDLRELFTTIMKSKRFIIVFTSIATFCGVLYSLIVAPTYEAKAILEIGSYNSNSNSNSNSIENPQNLIKRLEVTYIDNSSKDDIASLQSVSLVKNTTNLLELVVHSPSNEKALEKMTQITSEVIDKHNAKLNNYISAVQSKLDNLIQQKKQYEGNGAKEIKISVENFPSLSRYGTTMLDMINQIEDLKLSISKNNIISTRILGDVIVKDYPIKPKKSLIVAVSFVTSFILSIFLVFLIEFFKGIKNDEKLESSK